ncbi:hypothetical protein FB45DRAFT_902581 [Roridomyces roridus]|uniref:Glycosyl transferase family 25 domain-containing protein n=1 Tax=Roridomyces roridus TaxID=1738132 RepID=A0AAD7C3T7_9AGAR|nr:hypothetical protein FB45DRAFT_902581 [Roridomyces roridus]
MASPRSLVPAIILGAATTILVLCILPFHPSAFFLAPISERNGLLPVPSRTFVISLSRRKDRHEQMELLRRQLNVNWRYVNGQDSSSPLVDKIMAQVQSIRLRDPEYQSNTTVSLPFEWPDAGVPVVPFQDLPLHSTPGPSEPLTCANNDFTLLPYSPTIREYKILSRNRIACWHSHFSVIQHITTRSIQKVSLILEDDVDMELDIRERLLSVWNLLPHDWDVVFLGHCHSNESYYPALELHPPLLTYIHPSHAPLCTHAYALSATGARRLLWHLTYPPFAYSRSIDHALAWLIQSGRIKAFSIVPSVVVQRKIGKSDVMAGKGSAWRENLVHGVLAEDTTVVF